MRAAAWSGRASATLSCPTGRARIGDFVVHEETGDDWALVLASPRERAWPPGTTLFFNGAYFRLDRVDYDETYPAPYVYRFTFSPETEAIRRFVDYEAEGDRKSTRLNS